MWASARGDGKNAREIKGQSSAVFERDLIVVLVNRTCRGDVRAQTLGKLTFAEMLLVVCGHREGNVALWKA